MAWPSLYSDGENLTATRLNGWAAAIYEWGGDVNTSGYSIIVESSAPVDNDIPTRGVVVWIDEGANKLMFRLRYSDGTTLKSGEVDLT